MVDRGNWRAVDRGVGRLGSSRQMRSVRPEKAAKPQSVDLWDLLYAALALGLVLCIGAVIVS